MNELSFKVGDLVYCPEDSKPDIFLILEEKNSFSEYKYCMVFNPLKTRDKLQFKYGFATFSLNWVKING